MCGVAAIYAYGDPRRLDLDEIARINARMRARGPDGEGVWHDREHGIALAHRRLAIIDLTERGAQPMGGACRSHVVSFNGEIYNHREIRERLERKGHRFHSDCDTEVLLHLYEDEGPAMLRRLRGMFAFALWDADREALFLARDPYGIKPLYYAHDGATVRVASQVKALLAGGTIDTRPDPAGHVGFFIWGHVPDPHTLYRGIRALPAGSFLVVGREGPGEVEPFAEIPHALASAEREDDAALDTGPTRARLREALLDSVRHHLVADVEVGVFLSAGVDSAALAALATEAGGQLRTVTLGFEEYRGTPEDEVPLAEATARRYGTDHRTVWIRRSDFQDALPHLLNSMDQPTLDGVNAYFVSRAAATAGLKVALSGLGGDELFGSYPSFRQVPRLVGLVRHVPGRHRLGRGVRAITAPALRRLTSPKFAGLLEYGGDYGGAYLLRRALFMPWELNGLLDEELVRDGWRTLDLRRRLNGTVAGIESDRGRVSALESCWYLRNQLLRDADWAGMAHSLEVRVPFVDWTLLGKLAPLLATDAVSKRDVAAATHPPLPKAVSRRPKTGFTVPVAEWLLDGRRDDGAGERGLRGWARRVYDAYPESIGSRL